MNKKKIGRLLLMTAAALTATGGFMADWNKTHLFNPKWTPHAKFHDAMTILLGGLLGSSSLYLLQQKSSKQQTKEIWAALLPSFFWASMAGSFAFPGAKGLEAEFPTKIKKLAGVKLNEGTISATMLLLLWSGYFLSREK